MLIGITGGIGTGKSTIARELQSRGYAVYDTDEAAKRIIVHNPAVRSQVEVLFGSEIFDGDVYRTDMVARQVFQNNDLLLRLNSIVHPAVGFDLKVWYKRQMADSSASSEPRCFVESAILYSSGLRALCDRVVEVVAPDEVRIARTMVRDHTTREKVLARMAAQRPTTATTANHQDNAADIILNNDGMTPIALLTDELLAQL